jgi:hypothetical protein
MNNSQVEGISKKGTFYIKYYDPILNLKLRTYAVLNLIGGDVRSPDMGYKKWY